MCDVACTFSRYPCTKTDTLNECDEVVCCEYERNISKIEEFTVDCISQRKQSIHLPTAWAEVQKNILILIINRLDSIIGWFPL